MLIYKINKFIFDRVLSLFLIIIFLIPIILISLLIILTSGFPVLYFSNRVGKDNILFKMPKFRTMKNNTPALATHLINKPEIYIIFLGKLLRKTSLDELPQLYSIFIGKMSFVGPRPALYNQQDLISLRTSKQIHKILPGMTGLAQINGRDSLSIEDKVNLDYEYLNNRSYLFDIKIIFKTFFIVFNKDSIKH
tara:strand:+ start:278 stop:856 length:579 start_codon:yes stop_codon:yes gene_type:complete